MFYIILSSKLRATSYKLRATSGCAMLAGK